MQFSLIYHPECIMIDSVLEKSKNCWWEAILYCRAFETLLLYCSIPKILWIQIQKTWYLMNIYVFFRIICVIYGWKMRVLMLFHPTLAYKSTLCIINTKSTDFGSLYSKIVFWVNFNYFGHIWKCSMMPTWHQTASMSGHTRES